MAQQGRNSHCTWLAQNWYIEKGTWHIDIKCAFDKTFSPSLKLTTLTQELILNPLLSVKNICLVSEQQDGPRRALQPNNSGFSNQQEFLHQYSHSTQLKLWKYEIYWVHPLSTQDQCKFSRVWFTACLVQLRSNSKYLFLFNTAESFSEDKGSSGGKDEHIRQLNDIWKIWINLIAIAAAMNNNNLTLICTYISFLHDTLQ